MDGWNGPSIGQAQEYQDKRIWLRVGEGISYKYEMERVSSRARLLFLEFLGDILDVYHQG